VDISRYGNTDHIAPADMAALLHTMEDIAVRAVTVPPVGTSY
jgi:hypothetical protein